jgi:hypothetical protein
MNMSISEITQIWDRTLIKLQEKIQDRRVYGAFFPDTYIHSINNGIITVIANSSLAKSMLNTNYRDVIEETVGEITQSNYQISFIEKSEIPRVSEIISEKKETFFKNAKVNSNLTFDNFVVGSSSNLEAYQAAVVVANSPGKLYNPLFLYSASGLGKTHLLHAIGNHVKQNSPNLKVLYITADDDQFAAIKYSYSYTAQVSLAPEASRGRYLKIKQEILSYTSVNNTISWREERFTLSGKTIVKFKLIGNVLRMYIALTLEELSDVNIKIDDVSRYKEHELTPSLLRISGNTGVKRALQAIEILMQKLELKKDPQYKLGASDLPAAQTIDELLEAGLIRKI